MASSVGLTLHEPVIPLIIKLTEYDYQYDTLSRVVGAANEKRKAGVPIIETVTEVEYLLRVIEEFHDACKAERLSLTTGPNLFAYFLQVLGGIFRDELDVIRQGVANQTVGAFADSVAALVGRYVHATDLADQRHYLETINKPFNLDCLSIGGRLKVINKLMKHFPGANNAQLFNDADLKRIFYNMMLDDWKLAFLTIGHDISDPAYSLDNMVRPFELLEKAHNLKRTRESTRGRSASRNNRKRTKTTRSNNQGRDNGE